MYRIPKEIIEGGWNPNTPEECCESGVLTIEDKRFTFVKEIPQVEARRWADTAWFIFVDEAGDFWAVAYDYGSTENQESGYIYNDPVFFRVAPVRRVEVFWQKVSDV